MSIEESIQKAVAETISATIPQTIDVALSQRMDTLIRSFEDKLNLQTYTIQEAADLTGFYYKKLYRLVKEGVIPAITISGRYRIKHTDIYNFIESEKQKKENKAC